MAPLRGWVLRNIPVKPYPRGEMKCAECDGAGKAGISHALPARTALDHGPRSRALLRPTATVSFANTPATPSATATGHQWWIQHHNSNAVIRNTSGSAAYGS